MVRVSGSPRTFTALSTSRLCIERKEVISITNRTLSQLKTKDVMGILGVSRGTANKCMETLGGHKDACNRWVIDAKKFYAWYSSPYRKSLAKGGDKMVIERIMSAVQEESRNGKVSFDIHQRKGRNWEFRIYRPKGVMPREKSFSLGTRDKDLAKEIESEIRARLRSMEIAGIRPYPTATFFCEWMDTVEATNAQNTFKRYRAIVQKALPLMSDQVHTVTSADIERYKDWLLRANYKPESVILEINTLRRAFDKARKLGYTQTNPVDGVSKPKKPMTKVTHYEFEELQAIFEELERRASGKNEQVNPESWATYMEVCYCLLFTGMRISDALALRWENFVFKSRLIQFKQEKTRKSVTIRIPTDFRVRLERLAETRGKAIGELTGPVYLNPNGNPLLYSHMDSAIRKVLKAVNISKKSPLHSFRHTVAMMMVNDKVPVHIIANQLGDSVETIVRTYIQPEVPTQEDVDAVFSKVSGFCQDGLHKMDDFNGSSRTGHTPQDTQISASQKGFFGKTDKSLISAVG